MATRHLSVYIAGNPVIQAGLDPHDSRSLKEELLRYIFEQWNSDEMKYWFQKYSTDLYIDGVKVRGIHVRLSYVIKHKSSRRCIHIRGIVPEGDRYMQILTVDQSKETRLHNDANKWKDPDRFRKLYHIVYNAMNNLEPYKIDENMSIWNKYSLHKLSADLNEKIKAFLNTKEK